jgi:hypothetical protein
MPRHADQLNQTSTPRNAIMNKLPFRLVALVSLIPVLGSLPVVSAKDGQEKKEG